MKVQELVDGFIKEDKRKDIIVVGGKMEGYLWRIGKSEEVPENYDVYFKVRKNVLLPY